MRDRAQKLQAAASEVLAPGESLVASVRTLDGFFDAAPAVGGAVAFVVLMNEVGLLLAVMVAMAIVLTILAIGVRRRLVRGPDSRPAALPGRALRSATLGLTEDRLLVWQTNLLRRPHPLREQVPLVRIRDVVGHRGRFQNRLELHGAEPGSEPRKLLVDRRDDVEHFAAAFRRLRAAA